MKTFETILMTIFLGVLLIIAYKNPTTSPIANWHTAIDNGISWVEYCK